MNSIFLLNAGDGEAQATPISEAHFNLWMVDDERFLDVGLKLEAGRELELYLPWENAHIEDLYDSISQLDVLNAIFNQHLDVATQTSEQWSTVTCGTSKFDVMRAVIEVSAFSMPNSANNNAFTRVIIKRAHATSHVAYVRLRATGFAADVFDKRHVATGAFLNPHRELTEAVDFRINEIRTVKPSGFNKGAFQPPGIEKLHFFLLKSFHAANLLSSPDYYRCRELEDKAWEKYLPSKGNPKKIDWRDRLLAMLGMKKGDAILAYHWKKNDDDKIKAGQHFSVLATFGEKKTSWKIVLLYIGVIILINIASSIAYTSYSEWRKSIGEQSAEHSSNDKIKEFCE